MGCTGADRIVVIFLADAAGMVVSSSSDESAKRDLKVGVKSSSSLESAKRLVRAGARDGPGAGLDFPKPLFGACCGGAARRVGAGLLPRMVVGMLTGGGLLVEGLRNGEPVGESDRKLKRLDRFFTGIASDV